MVHLLLLLCYFIVFLNCNANICDTVPMTVWSDKESRRVNPLPTPVRLVVIQHTVTKECRNNDQCTELTRRIQSYHISQLGWTDIGQSFLIGGNGLVYEGSGWKHTGAHTLGYNNKSIGVSFIGDFRETSPTTAALKSAQDLLKCGLENKYLSEDYDVVGHCQISDTESPGAKLFEEIKTWSHWLKDATKLY